MQTVKKKQNLHGKTAVDKRAWIKACMYGLANLVKYWWMLVFNNCFFYVQYIASASCYKNHIIKTAQHQMHQLFCLHVLQLSNKRVNVCIFPWLKTELEFSNYSVHSGFFCVLPIICKQIQEKAYQA